MNKTFQQFNPIGAVFILCLLAFVDLHAQQSVGIGTAEPNPNAVLELKSDNQGILVPRLSTSQRIQMAQILNTTNGNEGMIVFDKESGKFYYWFGNQWNEGLGSLSSSVVNGDLDGSLPSPVVAGLQGRPVSSATPTNDQVLKWDGTAWAPSQDRGIEYEAIEGLQITGTQIKVGDNAITTQKIADEAITTDKIADNAVTLDKIVSGSSSTFLSIDANGILQWEDRSNMVASTLGAGKIFIGNNTATAEERALYGDVTITFDGETTIVDNSIGSSKIIDGSISTEDIADEAIANQKIADEAVTESKLANQAIGLQKIKTTGHSNAILTINHEGKAVWFSPGNNRVIITTNDGQIFTEGRNAFATSALPEGNIFVGNSEGQAYPFSARAKGRILIGNGITLSSVEVVGDINISDNGNADIQPNAVTSDKILDGTIADADLDKANIPLSGFGAAAADVDLGSNRLTQVAEPAGPQDAATKHYVDGQVEAATDLDEGHVYIGDNTGKATAVNASAAGNILIGDGTTLNPVTVTGDISLDADGTVTIGNNTVTSNKILDGTIQTADLGDATVTESKIGNGAVTTGKVADENITTAKLADNAVTNIKLASNAVTSDKILDGTVADADLDKASIPLSGFGAAAADVDLGSNRLTQVADPQGPQDAATKHYVDGQVGAATDLDEGHVYIGDNTGKATAVNASGAGNILIGDGTTVNPVPVGGDIALATDGTVTISNGAVTSAKILDGTIQTADLGDASVTEGKIGNGAVTTTKVADENITTAKLADNAVTNIKLASNAVTSDKILDGTIADADLDKANIPLSGFGTAAADVALGSNRLTQVADPAGPQDAATKHYVDGQVGAATDLDEGHVYIGDNTGKATAVSASAAGNILIGDGTTVNPVPVGGDISLDADGTVTISNGAVTSAKILDGTIQTADLGDASVTEGKIANGAVTTSKVADENITTAKLANNAVTSDKILDGTVADADLDKENIPLSGFGAAAADVNLGSNRLTQVAEPADPQDAATKYYVDGQVGAATDLDEGHVYIGDNTGKATAVNASGAGNILIGDGATVNPVPVGGDISLDADGTVTIGNGAVTSAKILDGTIADADLDKANIPLSGFGAAAADVDLGSNRLTQVADPQGPQDAATKHYVDGQVEAATDLDEGHVYIGDNTGKATAVNASGAGNILIGDGTTVNPVTVGGDISLDADGTVTISNGAVTSAKILDGTIQTADLGDASVTEGKIANSAVTTSKLADGNIITAKLADNAVTSDKILDGTIADADLDKANIPLSGFGAAAADVNLGSNRLTQVAEPADPQDAATKYYVDGQVGAATDLDEGHVYIGDNTGKATAVNASAAGNILIGDGTTVNPVPVGGDIALATDGTVTIGNNTVTSNKILDGTIQTADLGDASVTEGKIGNSAVTTSKVADGNITTAKLTNNAVTNIKLADNAVTSDKILDGTIADTDLDKANIPLSGFGAAAADVALGSNRLTQVADPQGPQDAATKYYVDALFAIDGDQDDENEIQDLSLSSHILSLSLSGSTVDLSPYLDNTDSQNLGSSKTGNQITVTIDNGTATTFDISDGDNDPTNESLTAAVLDGTDLRITESGNETIVDLSYLKDTYTAGDAIEVTGNNIAVQYDGVTIGLNASNELELMSNAVSNDKIANGTIDFSKMANSEAANGQVMVWSNALNKWTPGNATSILGLANGDITAVTTPNKSGLTGGKESGDVILSLENTGEGEILIGNGTNINTATVSGAITLSPSGSTSLNSSAVQNNHIADDAITTNKIADGAVTSEKLDAMSAIEGQVMTFKSGKWVAENPTSVFSSSITRTAYYSVDPLDFVVLGEADANHTSYPTNPEEATYVAVENFNNGANIAAPVHLPHGATIQEVSLYYMDDESGVAVDKDISFQLTRKARRNGTNEEIASFTSSGAAAIEQKAIITTITNGSVDNSLFSYRVIVRLRGTNSHGTSKHRIYSVVIKYSETIQND